MNQTAIELGQNAESRARQYLLAQGLKPMAHNVRYKMGELDLVMCDGQQWVFVEVRSRSNIRFGGAATSITHAKVAKLRRAANAFLQHAFHNQAWPPCRFDVIAIDGDNIQWIKNAFDGA
jgi:putative endonuclease